MLATLTVASFAFSLWQSEKHPVEAFYGPLSRVWELFAGGLLALAPLSRKPQHAMGILSLLTIVLAALIYSPQTPFPGAAALAPCLGACGLIWSRNSFTARLLSIYPLVFVGLISYSLYLWHWPIFAALRYAIYDPPPSYLLAAVMGSIGAAVLSWRYVEQPFRTPALTGTRLWRPAVASALILSVSTFAAAHGNGWPKRFPIAIQDIRGRELYNEGRCFLTKLQAAGDWRGSECFLTKGFNTNAMLWGDSFAAHYAPGITANPEALGENILQYTAASCPPYLKPARLPLCTEFNKNVERVIRQFDIKRVYLSARWEYHFANSTTDMNDIRETVEWLQGLGLTVRVIGQTPVFSFSDPRQYVIRNTTSLRSAVVARRKDHINQELEKMGSIFVDPSHCDVDCPIYRDGQFLVWDDGHLSAYGSGEAIQAIGASLRAHDTSRQ
jgi:hypothetical protein